MRQQPTHPPVGIRITFTDDGIHAAPSKTSSVVEVALGESLVTLSDSIYILP